jgi:HAD superfamily hydrolase (TIGR01509 family)
VAGQVGDRLSAFIANDYVHGDELGGDADDAGWRAHFLAPHTSRGGNCKDNSGDGASVHFIKEPAEPKNVTLNTGNLTQFRAWVRMMKGDHHITVKLKLPAGSFQAYLFDCDGTIADSMPIHYIAWKKALAEWNCTFEEQLFYAWGGTPVAEIISLLNKRQGLSMPVERVASRKEELYFELLPQLKAVPEVVEHIEAQHGRIPLAVVSGSTRDSVTASLVALKLLDRFDALVCAGDYTKSKPDPEAFLLAAARLGVSPETCLVFEDTDMGMQAAKAAGMASVKVPPPWEREAD